VPAAIDAICVGVADEALDGGHFGRLYPIASLPQTLRVQAGNADAALAWVRGDRGGVPALYVSAPLDFGSDVTLDLASCQVGGAGDAAPRGAAVGPTGALLAASHGQGGTLVVAIGTAGASVIDATNGALVAHDTPAPPPGTPVSILAADLDGDCDDDIVVITSGAAPLIWQREGDEFVATDSIGGAAVAAVAAADVEHDRDIDLVLGGGGNLQLWLNDGAAHFTHAAAALSAAGRVSAISALALGDLDGDANADLVVGQANAPLTAWLGEGGTFVASDAVVPAIQLDIESLTLADADGDFDPDLAIAIRGAPMRLLVDRDGRLEDQSFVRLPQPAPIAHAIAFGGWDGGCEPDAVIAAEPGAAMLRGSDLGVFQTDLVAPAATDVTMVDIDDDGDLDAIMATAEGVIWLAR